MKTVLRAARRVRRSVSLFRCTLNEVVLALTALGVVTATAVAPDRQDSQRPQEPVIPAPLQCRDWLAPETLPAPELCWPPEERVLCSCSCLRQTGERKARPSPVQTPSQPQRREPKSKSKSK